MHLVFQRAMHYPFPIDRRVVVGTRTWEFVSGDPIPNSGGLGVEPVSVNQVIIYDFLPFLFQLNLCLFFSMDYSFMYIIFLVMSYLARDPKESVDLMWTCPLYPHTAFSLEMKVNLQFVSLIFIMLVSLFYRS